MTPNLLFVDTSARYALLDRKDRNHAGAVRFLQDSHDPLVTSTYVLDETVTLVKRHLGHTMAARFGHQLWPRRLHGSCACHPRTRWWLGRYSPDILTRGTATPTAHPSPWQRLRLEAAFAYDAHFEQYGQLTRLPRD